ALAQQPRLAVGAPIAEGRKHQRDGGEAIEIGYDIVEVAVVRPDHAELAAAAEQGLRIFKQPCRRNENRAVAGQFGAISDMDEDVGGNSSMLNEWHRRAP